MGQAVGVLVRSSQVLFAFLAWVWLVHSLQLVDLVLLRLVCRCHVVGSSLVEMLNIPQGGMHRAMCQCNRPC